MIRRISALVVVAVMVAAAMSPTAAQAARKLRVVTTIPDLKSLAEAVGGDLVDVDSLTRGTQNFHEAEVKPSMMLKLRRADAVIENGLDLDAWADVAIEGSNNQNIMRGGPGRIEISRGVEVLEQNRKTFLAKLDGQMVEWTKAMEPVKGSKVVVYHPDFIYFLTRFGLVQAATLEDRPGIPASPQHLVNVIRQMKEEKIKVILVEPWNDVKLANRVAEEAGAKAFVMATAVGAVKGADNYIAAIDYNITTLSKALR